MAMVQGKCLDKTQISFDAKQLKSINNEVKRGESIER